MRHTVTQVMAHKRRGLFRWGLAGLLVLVVLFVPAQAARSDSPSQCMIHYGPNGTNPGLGVNVFSILNYDVPEGVNSVSDSATVPLYPTWNILFTNNSSATVTNPTITISSGLDPSVFDGQLPAPGLPSSCSQPSLDPSGTMNLRLGAPGSVQGGSLGYDSSAVAIPNVVPAAGGEVTEQFTVTLTDPRFAGGNIFLSTGNGDVSVLSQTIPQNLDQGENVSIDGNEWNVSNAQLDKPYVFTALVDVGTAGAAPGPYVFSPPGFIEVGFPGNCVPCGVQTTGSSVSIPDTSLDGVVASSVDQVDQIWTVYHENILETNYSEATFLVDQTPPVLVVPASFAVNATGPSGAIVTYTASATDNVDGAVAPICSKPSGSLFPIGDTVVTCSAVDAHHNVSVPQSFTVHVKGAAEQLGDLLQTVVQRKLGPGFSLSDKVRALLALVATNHKPVFCVAMKALDLDVKAQAGKQLTAADASALRAEIARIESVEGC